MWIDVAPRVAAVLVALVGLGLVADALLPEDYYVTHERRRRRRAERHRVGEVLVGAGLLLVAVALGVGDRWRYGAVLLIAGGLLVVTGAVLNRRFLRELFAFRGAARRADPPLATAAAPTQDATAPDRLRIR